MGEDLRNAVSRRTFLAGSLAFGGALLAGCGGSKPGQTAGLSASASAAKSGTKSIGPALRVGLPADVQLSAIQKFTPVNRALRRTVFDVLIERNEDGSYAPSLAKSWEWSADKTSLVLNLQDGVTFHSGRAFGADDVVYSLQAATDKKAGVQEAALLQRASSVAKSGPLQVTVSFDKPFVSYLDALALLPMVDQDTYAQAAKGQQVIGTGPFTWKSQVPGSKVSMGRNASYWQQGKPYVSGLEFTVYEESTAMLAAMQSGVLDLASQMLGRDAAKLQNNSKYQVGSTPGVDVYLGISTQIKPLDDVRVRQAIAYALDRKRIASQVYQGFADASCVLWDAKTAGVTDEMVNHYTYDVDKAKSLLQEAGAVGAQIEFAPSPQDPAFAAIGEIVQYNLEQIGIKIKRVSVTSAEWPKLNQAHNLPAMWVGQVELTGSGPVTTLLSSNPLTPDSNTSHFSPPDYQSKAAALLAAPSDDARSEAVAALTNYMLEQAFHDTVVQERSPLVSVSGLTGVGTDATYSLVLTGASLAS